MELMLSSALCATAEFSIHLDTFKVRTVFLLVILNKKQIVILNFLKFIFKSNQWQNQVSTQRINTACQLKREKP